MNTSLEPAAQKLYTGKFSLSANALKIIACVTMLIDHFGAAVYENYAFTSQRNLDIYFVLRYIGRIAFPIYIFLLVVGFTHTHSVKKYALRLFVFACVSEIPFDLAFQHKMFDFTHQNVYFTLFFGLLLMWCMRKLLDISDLPRPVAYILCVMCAIGFAVVTYILKTDYSISGVLAIGAAYLIYQIPILSATAACIVLTVENIIEGYSFFALIPILLYNGKRGRDCAFIKYFFYVFYPAHLLILYCIRIIIT